MINNTYFSNSFEVFLWPLKTPPPLPSLDGMRFSNLSASSHRWCHVMLQHAGIQHTTCSYLHSSIMRRSMIFLVTGIWGSMSFQRRNGHLFSSCVMYWECVVSVIFPFLPLIFSLDIQGHDPFLFMFNTKSCHCDTCHGSHWCTSCYCKPKLVVLAFHSCITGTRKSPSE